MAERFKIVHYAEPPFNSVAACGLSDKCEIASRCLRSVVSNQQGWFGSWIFPKDTGFKCIEKVIEEEKEVKPETIVPPTKPKVIW